MKLEPHLHYQFFGYDGERDKVTGVMREAVSIEVMDAKDEKEALEKARKIAKKESYYLHRVWECSTCVTQANQLETQLTNLKVLAKMLKN